MNQAAFQCRSCGGTDIQKLSMVYENGTSQIDTKTRGTSTGIGFGGGRVGIGSAVSSSRTTGTQMTELAKKAAPPFKKLALGWVAIGLVAVIGLTALLNSLVLGLLIGGGVCGYLAYQGFTYNSKTYPGLKDTWLRSWLCHRCGDSFTL